MRLGVMVLATDLTMPPAELAQAVEARGLSSLFLPEHTHIPICRRTPYPGGEPLKEEFYRLLDPLVALSVAAAATSTIELGTGVMLVNQHDPIVLAKQIATLDHLSNGRFVLGAGFGWNEEEMEHHGVKPKERRKVFRQKIMAMQALWTPGRSVLRRRVRVVLTELVMAQANAEALRSRPTRRARRARTSFRTSSNTATGGCRLAGATLAPTSDNFTVRPKMQGEIQIH